MDKKFFCKSEETFDGEEKENISSAKFYSDRYTIRGVIGCGAIGRVFLGFDKNIEREVAIKELAINSQDPRHSLALVRFIREARITAQLEHPGVMPVYELGVGTDGNFFYVMRYIKGKTLYKAIVETRVLSLEESFKKRMKLLGNLIDVCETMGYAHASGIVHRDLKPGNIILGKFGETIILDWGLAKKVNVPEAEAEISASSDVDDSSSVDMTESGSIVGTPSYMAPEQADSKFGTVDQKSDVYALGSILFLLLTGEKPYQDDRKEILRLLVSDNPSPSAMSAVPFVPPELSAICSKAMSKKKEDRFKNASEMADELKAYRDGRLVSAYAYTKKELFKRFVKKNKLEISAVIAVIMAIIIGAGLALDFGVKAHRARLKSERALMDVTSLSQSGVEFSRSVVLELTSYFDRLSHDMEVAAAQMNGLNLKNREEINPYLKKLHESHPQIKIFDINLAFKKKEKMLSDATSFHVPIVRNSKTLGSLFALMEPDKVISSIIYSSSIKSDYHVWCMRDDGYILYDEDRSQVGKYLFKDEIYSNFPELLEVGKQMLKNDWGVGYYKFLDQDKKREVYKVAVWDTVVLSEGVNWRVVVTHPYIIGKK